MLQSAVAAFTTFTELTCCMQRSMVQTGSPFERQVTQVIRCNRALRMQPKITAAYETTPCNYVIVIESFYGCGCEPFCYGRNCGSDGCTGYCGTGAHGACPAGDVCTEKGTCCEPDCQGRQCGAEDGCGGQCGICGTDQGYRPEPSAAGNALPSKP